MRISRDELLRRLAAHARVFDAGRLDANPFGGSHWLTHFTTHIVDDTRWQACVVESEDSAGHALMLLAMDPANPWRCSGLSNYYTSLFTPLYTSMNDRRVAANKLVGQLGRGPNACSIVQISPLDPQHADTFSLEQAFRQAGWYTSRYFCFGNWVLPCEDLTFERYMKARDRQLYNTWSRKAKKFKTGSDSEARLQIVCHPSEVAAAMDAYDRVYAKSWKRPEPYPNFVRGWAETCARQGWLRLGLAWIGKVPIAAQFWFTVDRRAYIFKLAYDEDYAKWSAGTVLTAHLMRRALDEDHVVEIDYLTGDDPYKKSWMTHRRERVGLLACNLRTARGFGLACREWSVALAKRWSQPSARGPEQETTRLDHPRTTARPA